MTRDRVIGADGDLPWHLPEDLAHFRATTVGKPVIMGRLTWESIGRVLPGRTNIVVSRTLATDALGPDVVVVSDLDSALVAATRTGAAEIMVIGGGQLYAEALDQADRLYVTEVDLVIKGDTWFPEYAADDWVEIDVREVAATDSAPRMRMVTLDRAAGEAHRHH